MQDKDLWTDGGKSDINFHVRGLVALPIGLKECKCPKCGGTNLKGALITETADEQDPNILCMDCGYWRD